MGGMHLSSTSASVDNAKGSKGSQKEGRHVVGLDVVRVVAVVRKTRKTEETKFGVRMSEITRTAGTEVARLFALSRRDLAHVLTESGLGEIGNNGNFFRAA